MKRHYLLISLGLIFCSTILTPKLLAMEPMDEPGPHATRPYEPIDREGACTEVMQSLSESRCLIEKKDVRVKIILSHQTNEMCRKINIWQINIIEAIKAKNNNRIDKLLNEQTVHCIFHAATSPTKNVTSEHAGRNPETGPQHTYYISIEECHASYYYVAHAALKEIVDEALRCDQPEVIEKLLEKLENTCFKYTENPRFQRKCKKIIREKMRHALKCGRFGNAETHRRIYVALRHTIGPRTNERAFLEYISYAFDRRTHEIVKRDNPDFANVDVDGWSALIRNIDKKFFRLMHAFGLSGLSRKHVIQAANCIRANKTRT